MHLPTKLVAHAQLKFINRAMHGKASVSCRCSPAGFRVAAQHVGESIALVEQIGDLAPSRFADQAIDFLAAKTKPGVI